MRARPTGSPSFVRAVDLAAWARCLEVSSSDVLGLVVPRRAAREASITPSDAEREALRHGWGFDRIERVDDTHYARIFLRGVLSPHAERALRALGHEGLLEKGGRAALEAFEAEARKQLAWLRAELSPVRECRSTAEAPDILALARLEATYGDAHAALEAHRTLRAIGAPEPAAHVEHAELARSVGDRDEVRRALARHEKWLGGDEELHARVSALLAWAAETPAAPPASVERWAHPRFGVGELVERREGALVLRFADAVRTVVTSAVQRID